MNKDETFRLLMMQMMSDIKDEFMEEFRDVVKQVINEEMTLLDRSAESVQNNLTYEEISVEYKVSKNSLKKWKKQGLLIPFSKGGKHLLFKRVDVEDCLRDRPRIRPNFLNKAS